jgi:multiple sugar transport system permease protein
LEARGLERNDSLLANHIPKLTASFALLKKNLTDEDKNYLDASLVECYRRFDITFDNETLTEKKPLLTPLMAGIIVFFVYPFSILIQYSFTFGVGGAEFAGMSTYVSVFNSAAFRLAFGNTVRFLLIGVTLNMALSFLLALLLRQSFRGAALFRSVILFPLFLPVAVVVVVVTMFFSDSGLVNAALLRLGAPIVDWLGSPTAFWLVLGLYIFKSIGYNVILLLAGMQTIPKDLYELADMEGAGGVRKVFGVTIPLLVPTLFFVFIISVMNSFRSFRDVFILGGKYPHDSLYMLPHFINNNMHNLNYQRLAVASVFTLLAIAAVTAVIYSLESRWEERL